MTWLSCSSGPRSSATARRRRATPRPASQRARPPGACGSAGSRRRRCSPCRRRASRRVPVVELGGVAQPVRLARRRRLPDLGLPAALPAARALGDAARGAAASSSRASAAAPARRALALLAISSSCSTSGSCSPRSRASRSRPRSPALYLWRGAAAEAARRPTSCAGAAPSLVVLERLTVADGRGLAAAPDARPRRRVRPAARGQRRHRRARWPRRSSPGSSTPASSSLRATGRRAARAYSPSSGSRS